MDVAKIFRDPRDMIATRGRNLSRLATFKRRLAERPWHPDAKKVWPGQVKRAEASIAAIDAVAAELVAGLAAQGGPGDVTIAVPAGTLKAEGK
jgi:hypothetical protein